MLQGNEARATVRRPRTRTATGLGTAVLAAVVLVGRCASSDESSADASSVSRSTAGGQADRGAHGTPETGSADAERAPGAAKTDGGADSAKTVEAAERHVVRTATLTVETKDVKDGLGKARTVVTTAGGYVAEETTDRDAGGEERSRVTFKVPPKDFERTLEKLSGIGKLVERESSAKDVTGDVVDVSSRIKSQRASVDRVRKLMDDATELSEVVRLESELSTRQADLEALQAQLQSLKSRSGMATVTLELHTPHGAQAEEEENEGTTVGDALAGGWNAFLATLRWIAVAIGAVLPFAAALAVLYGVWRVLRARLPRLPRPRRRVAAPPAPVTPPAPIKHAPDGTD